MAVTRRLGLGCDDHAANQAPVVTATDRGSRSEFVNCVALPGFVDEIREPSPPHGGVDRNTWSR